jgi:hypothetical protein
MSYKLDVGLTLLFAIAAPSAHANDAMTVFGHPVELVGTLNDQKLTVDGKVLVKDAIVSIEQINVVAGTGVLIGGSSGGGNACDIAPFVVSFPPGEQAKVDGPINECGMGNIIFHPGSIEFVYSALPNLPGIGGYGPPPVVLRMPAISHSARMANSDGMLFAITTSLFQ